MKFFPSKFKKIPRSARKSLLPRKEFLAQGKTRFLAAFDASEFSARHHSARVSKTMLFLRFGVGAMAVLCVAVGMSVYADTANVPPTSPLYSLKRLTQSVQLAVTPSSKKPELQATFAVQRANEIQALQSIHPTSTLIPQLTNSLDQDIESSLGTGAASSSVVATSSVSVPINVYCGAASSSATAILFGRLNSVLSFGSEALLQLNKQCGSEDRNSGSASVTSTIQRGHFHHPAEDSGHAYLPPAPPDNADASGSLETASTTVVVTTTVMTTASASIATTSVPSGGNSGSNKNNFKLQVKIGL